MIFPHVRVCFFFMIDALFLYRRHMINLKQQAVIVHCTTQVYRQQYVACQLYRHDFSNDVVSTVKHGIITNYNVCISDIVFQYHYFQQNFTRYPQYLHKNPSNFQPSGSPTLNTSRLLSRFPPPEVSTFSRGTPTVLACMGC